MRMTFRLSPGVIAAMLALAALSVGSYVTFARGPNDPATECLIRLRGNIGGSPEAAFPSSCNDGDACDSDGATNGSCTFALEGCVNVAGDASCTPQAIKGKPSVTPKSVGISLAANGTSQVCDTGSLTLKLKGKAGHYKPSKKKTITAKAKGSTKGVLDVDKLKLQCKPCPSESCVPTTTTSTSTSTTLPTTTSSSTSTSTSTSTTTTTLACGNGNVDPGEACDPDAAPNGCSGGTPFCNASCTACQANCSTLSFTIGLPSTACGFPGVGDPGNPPFTGAIKDGTDTTVSAGDLASGCLYIGGGLAQFVPPGPTPENGETIIGVQDCSVNSVTLAPSAGRGDNRSCSLGPKATKRCLNGHPGTDTQGLCTSDADCQPLCHNKVCSGGTNDGTACADATTCTGGGQCLGDCFNGPGNLGGGKCSNDTECGQGVTTNVCQPEAQCLFGAPLPFVNDPTSTCVINVIQDGVGGTADLTTGAASINFPLQSRVYLTGTVYGIATPCPKCVSNVCQGGKRDQQACSTDNSLLTTHDCPPDDRWFLAPLSVNLSPLTTGVASKTDAGGLFCAPDQDNNPPGSLGAFGVQAARTVVENGAPAGALGLAPKDMTLASVFCIPSADGGLVDAAANLPGPGATALGGQARLR